MKIMMFSAMQGRQPIVRLFHAGYRRLRADFDIDLHMAVSDDDDVLFCKSLGISHTVCPNAPVSNKHNSGIRDVLSKDWDSLLIMGSDDLLTSAGLDNLIKSGSRHVGFDSVVFVDSKSGNSKLYSYKAMGLGGHLIGAGRLISREVVMEVYDRMEVRALDNFGPYTKRSRFQASVKLADYLVGSKKFQSMGDGIVSGLWPSGINRGLDHGLEHMMVCNGHPPVSLGGVHVFDFKSMKNIWQYGEKGGAPVDFSQYRGLFSKEENDIINSLQQNKNH
jgi:hypothetical protein